MFSFFRNGDLGIWFWFAELVVIMVRRTGFLELILYERPERFLMLDWVMGRFMVLRGGRVKWLDRVKGSCQVVRVALGDFGKDLQKGKATCL